MSHEDGDEEAVSDVELDDEIDYDDLDSQADEGEAKPGENDEDDEDEDEDDEDEDEEDGEDEEGENAAADDVGLCTLLDEPPQPPRGVTKNVLGQAPRSRAIVVVPDNERVTSHIMTLAEMARAIALRAQQIAKYPSNFVSSEGMTTAQDIAQKELLERRSPLILRRQVGWTPSGERVLEMWQVRTMGFPSLY